MKIHQRTKRYVVQRHGLGRLIVSANFPFALFVWKPTPIGAKTKKKLVSQLLLLCEHTHFFKTLNIIVFRPQPFQQAPEGDLDNNIVEIKEFEEDKQGWWALVVEESRSQLYEDRVDHMMVKDVFAICQELVDAEEEDSNWLVDFVRNHPNLVPANVATHIALDLMKSPVDKVFPGVVFKGKPKQGKTNTEPAKARPKKQPAKARKSGKGSGKKSPAEKPTVVNAKSCSENHEDLSSYTGVTDAYYFQSGKKYNIASCQNCNLSFDTDGNKATTKKCPLPTAKAPVYICNQFELDKSTCGNLICYGCYLVLVQKSDATSTGRKRLRRG